MQQIITDVVNHINQCGGSYRDWYAGIASDPKERLFSGHGVNKETDAWIHRPCGSEDVARDIERHFLAKGCQGDEGGGDYRTAHFYAYKVRPHTRESNN